MPTTWMNSRIYWRAGLPDFAKFLKYWQTSLFSKKITNIFAIFLRQNFAIFWNINCQHWQHNSFWIIYQMNTHLERKYRSTLVVVSYLSYQPQIPAKHSYWYCVLRWNFSSFVKNWKVWSIEKSILPITLPLSKMFCQKFTKTGKTLAIFFVKHRATLLTCYSVSCRTLNSNVWNFSYTAHVAWVFQRFLLVRGAGRPLENGK